MKTTSRRAITRHAFYILKYGFFLVIFMLAYTALYAQLLNAEYGGGKATYMFYVLPVARAMLEHTLITLTLVVGSAFLCDVVISQDKS